MTTLMVFISPRYESSDTGIGDRLVERIEAVLAGLNAEYAARGISADYFGARPWPHTTRGRSSTT